MWVPVHINSFSYQKSAVHLILAAQCYGIPQNNTVHQASFQNWSGYGLSHGTLYNPIGMNPGTPLDIWATQFRGGKRGEGMPVRVLESVLKRRNSHGNTVTLDGPRHWMGVGKLWEGNSNMGGREGRPWGLGCREETLLAWIEGWYWFYYYVQGKVQPALFNVLITLQSGIVI